MTLLELIAQTDPTFWKPSSSSTYSADVDWLFYLIYWVSVFFTTLIVGLMTFFVIRYRQKDKGHVPSGSTHNTPLELAWSLPPAILVIVFFAFGFQGFLNMATPPGNSYEILVTAYKWDWEFKYPNGATSRELHVPNDRPIRLVLQSNDVIHSFYVPAFRIKKDCVPGRYNKTWFEAPHAGEYDLYCAEYCGTLHSQMLTKVVVHEPEDFLAWLDDTSNWVAKTPPIDAGKRLVREKGCMQCHSVDGTQMQGPTFKDLFGRQENLVGGSTHVADEAYIKESITYPSRKIVLGYENVMPTYQGRLKDQEITAIIEYMKSISKHYEGSLLDTWGTEDDEKKQTNDTAPAADQTPADADQ